MNDLTERLRIAADNLDHYSYPCVRSDRAWIAESCRLAADALEAAEAKLAAIDALLWDYMRSTTLIMEGHPSEGRHDAYMTVWRILHPKEGP